MNKKHPHRDTRRISGKSRERELVDSSHYRRLEQIHISHEQREEELFIVDARELRKYKRSKGGG